MKVPPKRKGNNKQIGQVTHKFGALNESPSEKEGKCPNHLLRAIASMGPSMKVPPKRKGNIKPMSLVCHCIKTPQ